MEFYQAKIFPGWSAPTSAEETRKRWRWKRIYVRIVNWARAETPQVDLGKTRCMPWLDPPDQEPNTQQTHITIIWTHTHTWTDFFFFNQFAALMEAGELDLLTRIEAQRTTGSDLQGCKPRPSIMEGISYSKTTDLNSITMISCHNDFYMSYKLETIKAGYRF